jgi:ACR3 family arsenite efflux pump ArsB
MMIRAPFKILFLVSATALASVVGVLVEVPVMLSVCNLCVRSQNWYEGPWKTA